MSKTGEILPLTSIRFFAALHVVLFHAWGLLLPSRPGPVYWNELISLGYAGVSLFFILSGYILAVVYLGSQGVLKINPKRFWFARFARIYPLYAFSLLLFLPLELKNLGSHNVGYKAVKMMFLSVANFGLLQAWHPVLGGGWNVPTWSISAEAFFYALFPLLAAWLWRKNRNPLTLAASLWLVSMILTGALSIALHRHTGHNDAESLRFNPLLRLPEFIIGMCAAKWQASGKIVSSALTLSAAGAFFVLVPVLVRCPPLMVSNGLLAPIFVLLLLGLSTGRGPLQRLLSARWLVALGHASFSLYLLHLPLLLWLRSVPVPSSDAARFFAYIAVAIGSSLLAFRWIELPARQIILKASAPALLPSHTMQK